ncbi:uncharacterized protein N7511_008513 [Penicillium nucicola]|uniref:uncharacterized protein n=1 Tax=Penicillium nucicola TaxID=1850975 RepID=UPI002544F387|nr:uncharacterized protein N7511_011374 [Penicillium nucicola]XP_056981596.1 uncharacterized protein N7511_008488 [Penicillium nucicola]XP_056981613.1 uncharacterized protein N7511_008505 [Penicillium nucicola]XP_056981621.1 uncharacterized protein N7511_008513 [Penicillium nucicola]KAJ5742642.1 hypothetical protein N7511_011374 [Penicillium nucicola]KAJ5751523.1 hypothetical protein N7511_008488 [Penicillium nucicola]KAJ5751540.1 hypothetical protein N7511_008505 [Penicillium nucicola]KAJ57
MRKDENGRDNGRDAKTLRCDRPRAVASTLQYIRIDVLLYRDELRWLLVLYLRAVHRRIPEALPYLESMAGIDLEAQFHPQTRRGYYLLE